MFKLLLFCHQNINTIKIWWYHKSIWEILHWSQNVNTIIDEVLNLEFLFVIIVFQMACMIFADFEW